MLVQVGQFRTYREGDPPEGTLTEMLGVEITDGAGETIVSIIVDPRRDGYIVQIDRYESGTFSAVDASPESVILRVPAAMGRTPTRRCPTTCARCGLRRRSTRRILRART
jgi:hypothetical protein